MNAATLLPSGLYDLLPGEAVREGLIVRHLLEHFNLCGYDMVSPPLMEYEESLLAGSAASYRERSFRVIDPLSGQMMAMRADMTMQIARIAETLMSEAPRPLRLCYGGQTLRSTPDPMKISRQFRQVGIEYFGLHAEFPFGEADVIQTAISGLTHLGFKDVLIDLHLPPLFKALTHEVSTEERQKLREMVMRKESGAIRHALLRDIAALSGPVADILPKLEHLCAGNSAVAPWIARVKALIALLQHRLGQSATITLDPFDLQGFDYYQGISFSLYLRNQGALAGRGGCYLTPKKQLASGFTLYTEDILPHLPHPAAMPRLLLSQTSREVEAAQLRIQGYITVYAGSDNLLNEATLLGCEAIYNDGRIERLTKG